MKFQILTDYFYRNNLFKRSVNKKGTCSKSKGRLLVVRDESNFTTRSEVGVGYQELDNPEKLATLGTQDTGPRQTKQKTQHRKLKRSEIRTPLKPGVNPSACEGQGITPVQSICVGHHYTQTNTNNVEHY